MIGREGAVMSMNEIAISENAIIPLVELSAELRRLGAQPPSCGSLRNAGYSGAFPIEKRAGKLVVRRADLPAIAKLYSANTTKDAAAA